MSMITNDMIIRFYSSIDLSDYSKTKTYAFKKEEDLKGPYIVLANKFIKNNKNSNKATDDSEDSLFYEWLYNKKEDGSLFKIRSLKYLNEDSDFVFLKSGKVNQKWHCLVSWYALKEYRRELSDEVFYEKPALTDKSCILKGSITCPELRLWLLEAAASQSENSYEKELVAFYNKAIQLKEKKITQLEWQKECHESTVNIIIPAIEKWDKENPKESITSDPFYSEGNIRYLGQKMEDYKNGRLKVAEHKLIEDGRMNGTDFDEFLRECMKDPKFKEAWDSYEEEFARKEALYKARKEGTGDSSLS